ncbi:MAG TPA: hypothetical protein PLX03_13670 [Candidatus Hydrogenedentes bacterium]|nr:hypothetical protein [Candidatus Hydrogenedentota bacterium]
MKPLGGDVGKPLSVNQDDRPIQAQILAAAAFQPDSATAWMLREKSFEDAEILLISFCPAGAAGTQGNFSGYFHGFNQDLFLDKIISRKYSLNQAL